MAYGYGTRRRRRTTYRSRSRAPARQSRSRRYSGYSSRRRPVRARRRSGYSRGGHGRTVRVVIQTVASSPLALGMKGNAPVRRMF